MIESFSVTNDTTPNHLDSFFTHLWKRHDKVKLVIDTRECSKISLGKILSIKDILDKHREHSRKHIDFTVIFVKSRFVRNIIRLGLCIIKTERPVVVETLKIKNA